MTIQIIEASEPTIVSAQEEKIFNYWAVVNVTVNGTLFPTIDAVVSLKRYRATVEGLELEPGEPTSIAFKDLFALAETNPKIKDLINLVNDISNDALSSLNQEV